MKRNYYYLIGLLALAIPMSINAQEQVDRMPKISGFVQGLYQANIDKDGKLDSNTFRMRRVRLSVEGKLTKTLSWKIQGDFSRSPMLVDAFVKYKPCNEFAIQIGQFKTPFTLENPINPLNLEIFDYGESIQRLVGYSDVCGVGVLGRDLGIMATGDLFPVKGKDFAILNYSIGLFNGNGPNALDNNNHKDLIGHLEIHPMLKELTLSGSYYNGLYFKDANNNGKRERWSAGIQYSDGDLMIRAEYLNGYTGYPVAAFNDTVPVLDDQGNQVFVESLRNSKGYYAVAGYYFHFGKDNSQKLMPVVRYEHFVPGDFQQTVYGESSYYTVGLNYWPVKSLNIKLDYSYVQEGKEGDLGTINKHRLVGLVSFKF